MTTNFHTPREARSRTVFQDTENALRSTGMAITKRALMQRLALVNDTGLSVWLGLPREHVEGWGDDELLPAHPAIAALLLQPEVSTAVQQPEDPDETRIVPVEVA